MLKKALFVFVLLATCNMSLAHNQTSLEQFSNTNKCSACDLSGAPLYYGMITNHSNCVLTKSNLTTASGGGMNFTFCDFT